MAFKAHERHEFDQLVTDAMKDWNLPGLAIAVIHGSEIFTKGYGIAKFPDIPVTSDTLFDCASTSKSFTAASLSLLVDNDTEYPEVKWTTAVSRLVRDDFVLPDPQATEQITIEDMLSHRSGMAAHDLASMSVSAPVPDTPRSITRKLRYLPMNKPIRTTFQYHNMMYTVASYLVESLSGESFDKFLRQRIWAPLGMNDTYLGADVAQEAGAGDRIAAPYVWHRETKSYRDAPLFIQPEGQGAGSIFSTVKEYAKWIKMMLDRAGPISEEGHKELVKPRTIVHNDPKPLHSPLLYALGWELETYRGYKVIGHDGSVDGFGSMMRYLPEQNWGVVIFGNADDLAEVAEIVSWYLIDELLGVPLEKRYDWNAELNKQRAESLNEQQEELYPESKEPPLPMFASLEEHAGVFYDKAYHDLAVQVKDGALYVDATDRSFPFHLYFEHVSGEYFTAKEVDEIGCSSWKVRAEFKIEASGVVSQLGIALEHDEPELLIWFTRVAK